MIPSQRHLFTDADVECLFAALEPVLAAAA